MASRALWLAMVTLFGVHASFRPNPKIGLPAGLIPDCPGVTKNASISTGSMPRLQVMSLRLTDKGVMVKKFMPITAAAKMMSRENKYDFKTKKTVLYAVGYFDSSWFPFSQAIGKAYARRGYNVLVSETFQFLTYIYPKSARLSKVIGNKIGDFLVDLTHQGLAAENLELVGISLGSHIAGYAAKRFYARTGVKPSRITGLDPSGPCFRSLPPEHRLNSSDAEKVEVIHTNIDGFGMAEPLGHIDYYVNGGEYQPGDVPFIPCLIICSHLRAMLYWWQSLEHPKKFIAVKCNSVEDARMAQCFENTETNYLGLEARFDRPGIFYLGTGNEFPYYRGKEGLKAENEIYTSVSRKLNEVDNLIV